MNKTLIYIVISRLKPAFHINQLFIFIGMKMFMSMSVCVIEGLFVSDSLRVLVYGGVCANAKTLPRPKFAASQST